MIYNYIPITHVESTSVVNKGEAMACELASVFPAPKSSRPLHDPASDDEPNDCVSLGKPFRYTIPSFDVLAVELRQMRIKGHTPDGEEQVYDFFVRNDPTFEKPHPAWMEITDATLVEVRIWP